MIEKYLYQLLKEQDEVVVPKLGTFVAAYSSSQIEAAQVKPPNKKVVFYPQLNTDNRNVLREAVVRGEAIPDQDFEGELESFLAEIDQKISARGQYELENLGTLRRKPNGELDFYQLEDQNLLDESFGLPTLEIIPLGGERKKVPKSEVNTPPTSEPTPQAEQTTQEDNNTSFNSSHSHENSNEQETMNEGTENYEGFQEEQSEKKSGIIMWLVIIPLVFVFIFLLYLFTQKDALNQFKSYINGEEQTTEVENTNDDGNLGVFEDENAANANETTTDDTNDENATNEEESTDEQESNEDTQVADNEGDTDNAVVESTNPIVLSGDGVLSQRTGKYHIIVGGFSTLAKAQEFRQKFGGQYSLKFIPHNSQAGFYRVSILDFDNEHTAYNKRIELASQYKDAWVLKY